MASEKLVFTAEVMNGTIVITNEEGKVVTAGTPKGAALELKGIFDGMKKGALDKGKPTE